MKERDGGTLRQRSDAVQRSCRIVSRVREKAVNPAVKRPHRPS
jgi:hypothetical protein